MLLSLILAFSCGGAGTAPERTSVVEPNLAQDLRSLREEEKLARDVYRTLGERWNLDIFERIASAEERHMARVGSLLQERQIDDPVVDDTVGAFTSPEFRALFVQLVERGRQSEVEALRVGALVEDLDIADIRAMDSRTEDPAAKQVYALLECGSRNHLRAFHGQLTSQGVTYAAEHITEAGLRTILAGSHERCGRVYGGGGMGGGGMGGGGMGGGGMGGSGGAMDQEH